MRQERKMATVRPERPTGVMTKGKDRRMFDAIEKQTAGLCEQLRVPTLNENIDGQIARCKEQLARLEEAKTLLDRNPEIERLLTLLGNGGLRAY